MNANRAHYALLPLLNSQAVLRAEIIEIYKTVKDQWQHIGQNLGHRIKILLNG